MGILELHMVIAALAIAAVAWSHSLRRTGQSPSLSRACAWLALGSVAAEIAVQAVAARTAFGAIESEAADKASRLARGVSLGLNAAAIEIAFLILVLGALAIGASRRVTT